jgi:hypothetical protein
MSLSLESRRRGRSNRSSTDYEFIDFEVIDKGAEPLDVSDRQAFQGGIAKHMRTRSIPLVIGITSMQGNLNRKKERKHPDS